MTLSKSLFFRNALIILGAFCLSGICFLSADELHPDSAQKPVNFMAYNIRNFLTMDRYENGERKKHPKPDSEVTPLIEIIAESKPDILGICEIGTKQDLQKFNALLKAKGLDYPFTEHTGGGDDTRHLALLSRYPILKSHSPPKEALIYQLEGEEETMGRGILHVEIKVSGHLIHFLGVHLKSKRPVPPKDQELIRINEARLLREHVDRFVKDKPDAKLIVYGDFNDTPRSRTTRTIKGHGHSKGFLQPIYLTDSRGEHWTHFWKSELSYTVLDYICVSKAIKPFISGNSFIIDDPRWEKASDHRPMSVEIIPE